MDDFGNFISSGGEPSSTFFCDQYDEKLEAEFIMRARSIFDEFVCPKTGTITISTFTELLHGITRLWALAQEMKGYTQEIHERLINLPLLFVLVLLRLIEKEYTQEDHEKTPADPQLGNSLLTIFMDMHSKLPNFKKPRHHRVLLNTCLMFLRNVLTIMGADSKIKRIKWSELNIKKLNIVSPIRNSDIKIFLDALRHFRKEILPKYSKRPVSYNLIFTNRYPEIMEPTRELQSQIADFFLVVSVWMIIFSILVLGSTAIVDKAHSPGGFSIFSSSSGQRLGTGVPASGTSATGTTTTVVAEPVISTGNFFRDTQRSLRAGAASARMANAQTSTTTTSQSQSGQRPNLLETQSRSGQQQRPADSQGRIRQPLNGPVSGKANKANKANKEDK